MKDEIAPLRWPEGGVKPPPRISVLGINSYPPGFHTVHQYISDQLRLRKPPSPLRWGEDISDITAGQTICRAIQDEFEWPNDHFVPTDPFEIAFLMPWDDMEVAEIAIELEEKLGISLTNSEIYSYHGQNLGDLVSFVARRCKAKN